MADPHIICITESWLSGDIQDSEILIPGYQSLSNDRNRHGGGVLMYVSHRFTVNLLPFHPSLEVLTVSLHSGNLKFCLPSFYRPPSSSVEVFSTTTFSQLTFPNLCNILSSFGLTDHAHVHQGNSHSLVDLVLMSNPFSLSYCQVIPLMFNSDHLEIKTEI